VAGALEEESGAGGRSAHAATSARQGALSGGRERLRTEHGALDGPAGFDGARAARWRALRRRLARDELAAAERLLRVIIADEGESAATRAVAAELSHAKSSPLPDKSQPPAGPE
jgi:hypothetical protein